MNLSGDISLIDASLNFPTFLRFYLNLAHPKLLLASPKSFRNHYAPDMVFTSALKWQASLES